jgi:hypothetical protein
MASTFETIPNNFTHNKYKSNHNALPSNVVSESEEENAYSSYVNGEANPKDKQSRYHQYEMQIKKRKK